MKTNTSSLSLSFSSVFSSVSGQSYKFDVSTAAWQTDEAWLNRRVRGTERYIGLFVSMNLLFTIQSIFLHFLLAFFRAVGEEGNTNTDHMKYCLPPHS